jgi:polyisoprenoid-binding protein YceI
MKASKIVILLTLVGGWIAVAVPFSVHAGVETYKFDKDHSFANWRIRHVVSYVSGTFSDVEGNIVIDPENLSATKVDASINVFSLNSTNTQRDVHLLSSEFLDALKFQKMHFVSTGTKPTGKDTGILEGQLTLHGVTRSVELPFKVLGFGADPWGGYRAGFQANTALKRSDYGVAWGLDLPGGGPVGDEVQVELLMEGVKLGPDAKPVKVN